MNRTNREREHKKKQQHHSVGLVQGSRVANSNKQRTKRNSCKKAIDQRFVYLSHRMHSIQKRLFRYEGKDFFFFNRIHTHKIQEKRIKNRSVN